MSESKTEQQHRFPNNFKHIAQSSITNIELYEFYAHLMFAPMTCFDSNTYSMHTVIKLLLLQKTTFHVTICYFFVKKRNICVVSVNGKT